MSLVVGLTLIVFLSFLFCSSFCTWTNGRLGVHKVNRKLDRIFVDLDSLFKGCDYFVLSRNNSDYVFYSVCQMMLPLLVPLLLVFFRCDYNMMVCNLWLNHHLLCSSPFYDISNLLSQEKSISQALNKSFNY